MEQAAIAQFRSKRPEAQARVVALCLWNHLTHIDSEFSTEAHRCGVMQLIPAATHVQRLRAWLAEQPVTRLVPHTDSVHTHVAGLSDAAVGMLQVADELCGDPSLFLVVDAVMGDPLHRFCENPCPREVMELDRADAQ